MVKRRGMELPLPNQPMDTQCQHEEQNADASAHQQRMFCATKSAADKTGDTSNCSDRKSSSRNQSAGFLFHGQRCIRT